MDFTHKIIKKQLLYIIDHGWDGGFRYRTRNAFTFILNFAYVITQIPNLPQVINICIVHFHHAQIMLHTNILFFSM
jgi:hypothetical protein